MRLYELVLVLKTSLSEAERTKVLDAIKELVKDLKVTKDEDWGQKPLSYKIKKEAAGVYHMLKLEGENPVPADFEARLLRNDNVLRHLLVRVK
jgi:small subunit ribosomal protein S6